MLKLNKDNLELLREWIRAEIEASIASNREDSEGYLESGYFEYIEADKLFNNMVELSNVETGSNPTS